MPEGLIDFRFNPLLELTDGPSAVIALPIIPHGFQSLVASRIRLIGVEGKGVIFLQRNETRPRRFAHGDNFSEKFDT